MKIKLRSLALGLFASLGAFAQSESLSFSLAEAENYAASNAYQVQDKNLEYEKARKTIKETAALGLPQVGASFGYSYNAQIAEQPIPAQFIDPNAPADDFITLPFGVAHQNQAAIQANQLILDASYFVALQATRVVKETTRLEQEQAEIDVRKTVAQNYYAVLVARRATEILEENIASMQKNFRETKKLNENGFVESQDVDQMELLINNLQNSLANAKRQEQLAFKVLKFSIGMPLERELTLTDKLEDLLVPDNMVSLINGPELVIDEHISYRTVLSQERAASLQLKNERAKYFPTLSGFVQHSQSNFANDFNQAFSFNTFWIPATTLGLNLQWNIFTGFARSARAQKAQLDLERIQVAKTLTEDQLKLDYERALSDFRFAMDSYESQRRNLELSKKIRDRTLRKYQEGISSSLELTQAENQYLDTEGDYINAMASLLNAKEALENALGK